MGSLIPTLVLKNVEALVQKHFSLKIRFCVEG